MKDEYFEDAISFENLYKGLKKSCRNVRWKDSVVGYENNGLKNTLSLRKDLLNDKYRISKYQEFTIHEPKTRTIIATRIRDRQFQRSLCDSGLYEDVCEHFIRDNSACQRGKGTDDALNRLKIHIRRFFTKNGIDGWVLKCDIHHFFPETSHAVAKEKINKYVYDEKARQAVYRIIDSFDGDKGIGLGSQVSQLIQLCVLNDLDHYIKEKLHIRHYVRYMDDFILIHENKEYLQHCRKAIETELSKLGLELNRKTTLFPLKQGIYFLKWRFLLTESGKVLMLMDAKKVYKQKRKLKKLLEKERDGILPEGTAKNSLDCWLANASKGNSVRIMADMKNFYYRQKASLYEQRIP